MKNKIITFIYIWLLCTTISSILFYCFDGFAYHGFSGTFELPILIGFGSAISHIMDS